ncbi:MAG TPA: hypothetical protein VND64_24430 [Pirellulales bacterium]|nr:hypothetical protein [Pirellulales bacterium]
MSWVGTWCFLGAIDGFVAALLSASVAGRENPPWFKVHAHPAFVAIVCAALGARIGGMAHAGWVGFVACIFANACVGWAIGKGVSRRVIPR